MTPALLPMFKLVALPFVLCFTLLLNACSSEPTSPEDQIKATIAAAIDAAENRSASDLSDLIDTRYLDQKGLNKTQLIKLAKLYFFRHKSIYLFSKIGDIDFPAENKAFVTLHVAMAGSAISDVSALTGLQARLYRFEIELIKEDDWLLRKATWRRASMSEIEQ